MKIVQISTAPGVLYALTDEGTVYYQSVVTGWHWTEVAPITKTVSI